MISKDQFIRVIESLHQQYLQDKDHVADLTSLYGPYGFSMYDNGKLINSVFEMLRVWFPVDEKGFCEIEHFCYVCDFGKIGDYSTTEALWEGLVRRVKPD
ncbi:MAG: hypothetical protein RIQ59_537 [Bacteroidota bacterium]|jgi:hypothetical protein